MPAADQAAAAQRDALVEALPPASRLALAYAPAAARLPTLALFALDARLAGLLRHSREPMLAQLRLAWWRESLARDRGEWPQGEPLLAALHSWNGTHPALAALVDGWEALTCPAPLPEPALRALAAGRAAAFAALARALGREAEAEAAHRLGERWGLADLATRLGHPQERAAATALAEAAAKGPPPRVSRPLRPLLVLATLTRRRLEKGEEAGRSPAAMLAAMRAGWLGR